ncbi:Asp23/Gls24 family protein [Streptomyces sp. NTH33]|uniref:Asp23/Gls24 family envelope stress response protein n=1 Tax=Streptomyces sp. NTH33 TaxID=1735453 RepID=UPI000DAA7303|nr:Asp23/Gls24 family envelope stress response protein [Streptomyces sp. NTH33]PZG95317.1 Asp23/Gls24 family protein [Streptomyces sp. NTH33]
MKTRPGSPPHGKGPGPSARAAGLPPPAERGATVIPDRVVARIAAQAARTVQSRRTDPVRLHLTMDLPYPTDIPHVCERIQRDVAERVAQLTGLQVGEVTLTVRRLVTAATNRGRVR